MSSGDDLRKPTTPAGNSPILPEQQPWDGGWTGSLAAVPNPFTSRSDAGRAQQAVATGEINTASLVAFFQDGELIPTPQPADLDVQTGESVQPGQGGNAAGNGQQADSLSEAERLGTAPEDNTLQFLRTATVLLEPGESQCDVGVEYTLAEADFPILLVNGMGDIVDVADAKFRVRQLAVPIEYRTGLHKRVQGFIGAPVGWANTQVSVNNDEAFKNNGGLGDVNFGLTMQLVDAEVDSPYWVATLAATAPTGGDPFTGLSGIAPSAPALGEGFWSIQGNLLLIQPYDPIVVFYGLGMERSFSHEYIGLDIQPGAEYSYSMGVGFAVNDRVTLSSRFRGAYVEETEVDGLRIIGSNAEPMTIRLAATISKPCNRIVEPFVEFGLTSRTRTSPREHTTSRTPHRPGRSRRMPHRSQQMAGRSNDSSPTTAHHDRCPAPCGVVPARSAFLLGRTTIVFPAGACETASRASGAEKAAAALADRAPARPRSRTHVSTRRPQLRPNSAAKYRHAAPRFLLRRRLPGHDRQVLLGRQRRRRFVSPSAR
jgi:hypothetical protein